MSRLQLPRAAWAFGLTALINVLVGGMVGLERTVVPLVGTREFDLAPGGALAGFIISFGVSKALVNALAGMLADRVGRKRVLLAGWALGVPVPLALIWAPSWGWVVAANVLLGVNQALAWSMTVNIMVDLMPPYRRGLAAGLNEFAGYVGVSALALATGLIAERYGLRPAPFYLGIGLALGGLALSALVPETAPRAGAAPLTWVRGVELPGLLGGLTNLKDGLVWLMLPVMMGARGFGLDEIGLVAGLYPLVWAAGQPLFGPLSDRLGRWRLILPGMLLQGAGLVLVGAAGQLAGLLAAALLLGLGTAMAYPTLIALVADRAPLAQRGSALGLYRFFRDGGYALGALIAALAPQDLSGLVVAVGVALAAAGPLSWWASGDRRW